MDLLENLKQDEFLTKVRFEEFINDQRVTDIVDKGKYGQAFMQCLEPYMDQLDLMYLHLDAMMEVNQDKMNAQNRRLSKTNRRLAFSAFLLWIIGMSFGIHWFQDYPSQFTLIHIFLVPLIAPVVFIIIILLPMNNDEYERNILKARIVKRAIKFIEYS